MTPVTRKTQVPQDPFLSCKFLRLRRTPNRASISQESQHYFFNWARNGIYHSLRAAKILPGDSVLVPSYVCKVVPEAIQGYGASVLYYRVAQNCSPDFSDLDNKLDRRTRALVAVHYFGFPQPVTELREFCDRHGLYFIEDCAHVLRTNGAGGQLGSFGDASVFSLRKFFPLYDGAELILNRSQDELQVNCAPESLLYTLKTVKDGADQLIAHSLGPIARAPFEYLMSRAKSIFAVLKTRSSSRALTTEKTDAAFDLQLVNLSMSGLSSLLYAHFDASKIEAQRRANFAFLRRELSSLPGLRFLYSELPAGVCPWVFPVIFGEQQDACQALRAEHIPASNWGGVRPLDLPLGAFPDADFLYRNLVFLPVHQNLTTEDLQQI